MKRGTTRSISGVTEVEYRRAMEEQRRKSSMDAAALQQDLAKRLKLPGTTVGAIVRRQQQKPSHKEEAKSEPRSSNSNASTLSSSSAKSLPSNPTLECASCGAMNYNHDTVCTVCGYYLAGVQQAPLTLAQRRGLVQAAPKIETISPQAWADIERRVDNRQDAFCPICMEAFKTGHEVLLSCSHMFHRQCLQSFEQFMGKESRSCPICRTSNYQKKITQRGSKAFEIICSVKIQAMWRGSQARSTFRVGLRSFYQRDHVGRGTGQRRRFYEKELSVYADKMAREVEVRSGLVDSVLNSMDQTLNESRQLDMLFDSMLQQRRALEAHSHHNRADDGSAEASDYRIFHSPRRDEQELAFGSNQTYECAHIPDFTEEHWKAAVLQASSRGHEACAICMSTTRSGLRGIIILSCSHVFHQQCIMNLEKFLGGRKASCCICRHVYKKRSITQNFDMLE